VQSRHPNALPEKYSEAVKWHQDGPIPVAAGNLIVKVSNQHWIAISFFPRSILGRWNSGGRVRSRWIPVVTNCKIIEWRRTSALIRKSTPLTSTPFRFSRKIAATVQASLSPIRIARRGPGVGFEAARRRFGLEKLFVVTCRQSPAPAIPVFLRWTFSATSCHLSVAKRKKWKRNRKSSWAAGRRALVEAG